MDLWGSIPYDHNIRMLWSESECQFPFWKHLHVLSDMKYDNAFTDIAYLYSQGYVSVNDLRRKQFCFKIRKNCEGKITGEISSRNKMIHCTNGPPQPQGCITHFAIEN